MRRGCLIREPPELSDASLDETPKLRLRASYYVHQSGPLSAKMRFLKNINLQPHNASTDGSKCALKFTIRSKFFDFIILYLFNKLRRNGHENKNVGQSYIVAN